MLFEVAYGIMYLAQGTIFEGLARIVANNIYPF